MKLHQISGFMPFKFCNVQRHAVIRMTGTPELKSRNRMFIAGMGFVGQVLAEELKNRGWAVSGTCTGSIKKKKLEEERGLDIYLFDANQPDVTSTLDVIKDHTHRLVFIPPVPGIGDPMLQNELLLRRALMGVYGDSGGAWVDEDAVDTIIKWGALSESQRMRGYRRFTSRVNVEEICQALKASLCTSSSRRVYNIADDEPAPREEVFEYARDLVEKKWPGWIKHSSEQKESSVVVKKED